jgi:hypothetical protein
MRGAARRLFLSFPLSETSAKRGSGVILTRGGLMREAFLGTKVG